MTWQKKTTRTACEWWRVELTPLYCQLTKINCVQLYPGAGFCFWTVTWPDIIDIIETYTIWIMVCLGQCHLWPQMIPMVYKFWCHPVYSGADRPSVSQIRCRVRLGLAMRTGSAPPTDRSLSNGAPAVDTIWICTLNAPFSLIQILQAGNRLPKLRAHAVLNETSSGSTSRKAFFRWLIW